jgi:hypothetical protein
MSHDKPANGLTRELLGREMAMTNRHKTHRSCAEALRIGGTGMTVAYCSKTRKHFGRHSARHSGCSYGGMDGFVYISWPNKKGGK